MSTTNNPFGSVDFSLDDDTEQREPLFGARDDTGTGGRVCPKCAYERKATDTAPDYECPKCGVVYAKVRVAAEVDRNGFATGAEGVLKPCAFCGRRNMDYAVKCAHCGSLLSGDWLGK